MNFVFELWIDRNIYIGGVWPATDSDLRSGLGILKSDFGNLDQAGLRSRFEE